MAGLGDMKIVSNEYRPCIVNEKRALFHRWIDIAYTVGAEMTVWGKAAGQVKDTLGIVEYEDGTVNTVKPGEIQFCDDKIREYAFIERSKNNGEI